MNHWLILILTAVAMVAILVLFAWWWTTENWDWASAELKPPRTVSDKAMPKLESWLAEHCNCPFHRSLRMKTVTTSASTDSSAHEPEPQLHTHPQPLKAYLDWVNWREELEQRVTALEEKMPEDMNLHLDQLFSRLQIMERKLDGYLEDSPSPPTASPTTDSPSDAVQETTGVWTPQSWQLDPRITPGGPVGFGSEFVDPSDAWT
jgi:hypothetical protein